MKISVVVPCYNEQESLPIFYREFCKMRETTEEFSGVEFELMFVDDGSYDSTFAVMQELAEKDNNVKYISFSRNFGKEAAIYAGLQNATGDLTAVMDVDLQDPLYLLLQMYKAVIKDGYDSAAARRVTRKGEPPIRSFFARCFYRLIAKISKIELVDGARDYRLMNRKFVNAVLSLKEYNRFSKGIFCWVGFKNKWLEFENVERRAGETKWSFWKLSVYAIDGIIAFSTVPLVLATAFGVLLCLLAFLAIMFVVLRKLIYGDPIQGWASTMCVLLTIGGVQLLCTGILGQYLAKTYMETKNRPVYIINKTNCGDR
ncbi:MAG: glycosyltransferase family 2 protein [Synergistaceae bacterium]|nr:glycosyltransferase family 2 protein [Synergistaceae bacterium]